MPPVNYLETIHTIIYLLFVSLYDCVSSFRLNKQAPGNDGFWNDCDVIVRKTILETFWVYLQNFTTVIKYPFSLKQRVLHRYFWTSLNIQGLWCTNWIIIHIMTKVVGTYEHSKILPKERVHSVLSYFVHCWKFCSVSIN